MPELLEEAMRKREKDKDFCKEFDEKIAAMVTHVTSMLSAPAVSPQLPVAGGMNRPLMEPYREVK
jgi:tRNA A37 threonylcarbamoyltransferase TsaD